MESHGWGAAPPHSAGLDLEATADLIGADGAAADAVALDITDEATAAWAMAGIIARHGGIDVLVNNAGVLYRTPARLHHRDTGGDDSTRQG